MLFSLDVGDAHLLGVLVVDCHFSHFLLDGCLLEIFSSLLFLFSFLFELEHGLIPSLKFLLFSHMSILPDLVLLSDQIIPSIDLRLELQLNMLDLFSLDFVQF